MYVLSLQANGSATDNGVSSKKSDRIPSHDFRAWDKFDADKEAEKVDKERSKVPTTSPKGIPLELSDSGKPPLHHSSLLKHTWHC